MPDPSPFPAPMVDQRRLLEFFPQARRSLLANLFLHQLRGGTPPSGHASDAPWTPELLRVAVLAELTGRLRWAFRHRQREEQEKVGEIIATLNRHQEAALDFARWALAWEATPPEERERQKRGRSSEYIRSHMDREVATERQIAFLRRKGYTGPIDSKAHASSLIDVYCRGGRVEVAS